ncbi:MAG TPA: Ig-like domain-containing protein [Fibrobacteraceae bacterium]|jgi:hypothetical protein|nr:Ig-like domain-containing protein [Fibrobacter sp.]HPW93646.1 Ig-like domain-containing protein [Fibrobacteraceae bacterium]
MLVRKFIFLGCIVSLFSCATQVPPEGGPEDKLPPRIAAIAPAPNSINQEPKLNVKILFDEWINATIPKSAITISPPIEKKMIFEVNGEELLISSRSVLDSNTTYTLTVASGIKDLRGNSVAKPFELIFSTGSYIDSLSVSGRVMVSTEMLKKKQYPSIGLFLIGKEREGKKYLQKYKDTTLTGVDSLPRLSKEPPLFITQADSNGWFSLGGLHAGRYRVVSFVDVNGNRRIEPSVEWAGVYERDIELTETFKDSLWIALADQDTSLLELQQITQVGKNLLQAKFSRFVHLDSFLQKKHNCFLTKNKVDTLFAEGAFKAPRQNDVQLYFEKAPSPDSLYEFKCLYAVDSLARSLDTLRNSLELKWDAKLSDTLAPVVAETVPVTGSKLVFPNEKIEVAFNKPVSGDTLASFLKLVINGDTGDVVLKRKDTVRFEISTASPWPTDGKVELLNISQDTVVKPADSTGYRDTVITPKFTTVVKFETVPKLKIASLEGKIPGTKRTLPVVRLRSLETGKVLNIRTGPRGVFSIDNLLEGNYILDYYYNESTISNPDAGSLSPAKFGAGWRSPSDTLILLNGKNKLDSLIQKLPSLP